VFEGEPITVPVEKVAMLDVLLEVIERRRRRSPLKRLSAFRCQQQ